MKRITIGRDETCDFRIPLQYGTVSNSHAYMEEENGKLYFCDHSRNGSVINGQRINQMTVEVRYGDEIKLSNIYPLSWSSIQSFFPHLQLSGASVDNSPRLTNLQKGRMTEMHNTPINPLTDSGVYRYSNNGYAINDNNHSQYYKNFQVPAASNHKGWNWGAFLLGWIWGVGHSCWWPLFATIGINILSFLLVVAAPVIGVVIYSLSCTLQLAMAIYLGAKGNSIGWENGCYENIDHFRKKEHNWTIAALVIWGLYIIVLLVLLVCVFSMFGNL